MGGDHLATALVPFDSQQIVEERSVEEDRRAATALEGWHNDPSFSALPGSQPHTPRTTLELANQKIDGRGIQERLIARRNAHALYILHRGLHAGANRSALTLVEARVGDDAKGKVAKCFFHRFPLEPDDHDDLGESRSQELEHNAAYQRRTAERNELLRPRAVESGRSARGQQNARDSRPRASRHARSQTLP